MEDLEETRMGSDGCSRYYRAALYSDLVPIGSLTRIRSVSLLGFPVPARFSARTLNLYFFLVARPLTLREI